VKLKIKHTKNPLFPFQNQLLRDEYNIAIRQMLHHLSHKKAIAALKCHNCCHTKPQSLSKEATIVIGRDKRDCQRGQGKK
jgi:hypothetical protein